LDKVISQNIEGVGDDDRCTKDGKGYQEDEANTMIMEVEGSVLTASITNRMTNVMNIAQISEDLQYLVQSDIDE